MNWGLTPVYFWAMSCVAVYGFLISAFPADAAGFVATTVLILLYGAVSAVASFTMSDLLLQQMEAQ